MQIETNYPDISFSAKTVASIPWVEKYRPHQLNQLISHESILTTLRTFIKDSNLPNLLFYGPPGTGKTSTILALAKQLYQKDFKSMVLELNASDERGINVVRDLIKSFAGSGTLSRNQNLKLVILDESDIMTKPAQFALRRSKLIQKYHSNARFCLISNYVSKIIPALQSRCTRFKFKQISLPEAKNRIVEICMNEKLNISDDGIEAVFKLCQGDMRRVVNMLQSLSMIDSGAQISSDRVYQFTGNPSPKFLSEIMDDFFNKDFKECYQETKNKLKELGIALETIVKQLYQMLLAMTIPGEQKIYLIKRLGDIEYRLSLGCQEKLCLASLVGAFVQVQNILKAELSSHA